MPAETCGWLVLTTPGNASSFPHSSAPHFHLPSSTSFSFSLVNSFIFQPFFISALLFIIIIHVLSLSFTPTPGQAPNLCSTSGILLSRWHALSLPYLAIPHYVYLSHTPGMSTLIRHFTPRLSLAMPFVRSLIVSALSHKHFPRPFRLSSPLTSPTSSSNVFTSFYLLFPPSTFRQFPVVPLLLSSPPLITFLTSPPHSLQPSSATPFFPSPSDLTALIASVSQHSALFNNDFPSASCHTSRLTTLHQFLSFFSFHFIFPAVHRYFPSSSLLLRHFSTCIPRLCCRILVFCGRFFYFLPLFSFPSPSLSISPPSLPASIQSVTICRCWPRLICVYLHL